MQAGGFWFGLPASGKEEDDPNTLRRNRRSWRRRKRELPVMAVMAEDDRKLME